jgi:hypothetical protein
MTLEKKDQKIENLENKNHLIKFKSCLVKEKNLTKLKIINKKNNKKNNLKFKKNSKKNQLKLKKNKWKELKLCLVKERDLMKF